MRILPGRATVGHAQVMYQSRPMFQDIIQQASCQWRSGRERKIPCSSEKRSRLLSQSDYVSYLGEMLTRDISRFIRDTVRHAHAEANLSLPMESDGVPGPCKKLGQIPTPMNVAAAPVLAMPQTYDTLNQKVSNGRSRNKQQGA